MNENLKNTDLDAELEAIVRGICKDAHTHSAIKNEIFELEKTAKAVRERMQNFTIDESDHMDSYDEKLDECLVKIAGLEYLPSAILKSVDETAYRCGLLQYIDSIITETPEYLALVSDLEELELEINSLEIALEELAS